jgi:hypothetical protein
MRRLTVGALTSGMAAVVLLAGTASGVSVQAGTTAEPSGPVEFRDADLGAQITECPQAGMNTEPRPLDRRERDEVERLSNRGNDTRANTEYSCFPQNETTIVVNPTDSDNIIGAQNDYRMGGSFNGINATTDGGRHWYDLIGPFPSVPNVDTLDSAGDPALTFDRQGTAYYASIDFNRTDDTNGIWVNRSTNGGFTWSRGCVAIDSSNPLNPSDDIAVCGGPGDPRTPGDGTVSFQPDNNLVLDDSVPFEDKEYIDAGPRPDGVAPTCFAPETKTPIPAGSPGCPEEWIGPDRVYVTWTRFALDGSSRIHLSYSDDRARSWSVPKPISGSAPFCAAAANDCRNNQFSVPTVSPETGHLYVAFENFNAPDEHQWLVVRSSDGGATFQGPFFVTPSFDVNFRTRPDCVARGAGSSLTNTCFRIPKTGVVGGDWWGGSFTNHLYLVMSDNRNGTRENTNTDVFFFKSIDGGSSWIGPTRVNDDDSDAPANRDCGRTGQPPCLPTTLESATGNDQWWPWIDISDRGDLNVKLLDRRLDTNSVAHEWPTSRQRPGNYLVWTWAAQCRVTSSTLEASAGCVADGAEVIPQPTAPINPSGPYPGAGPDFTGTFRNFKVSDVPSNYDYCFRAGVFCGDYESIAVSHGQGSARAVVLFTDARNGRSSGGPAGGGTFPSQPGRNPSCEQSDVFFDRFSAVNGGSGGSAGNITPFLVTPCPVDD